MRRAWDDDERNRDKKGRNPFDDKDEDKMFRLHEIDLYDQDLLEVKRLVNERKKAPENRRVAYTIAINNMIANMEEEYVGNQIYPYAAFKQDIELALKGGKYRKYYQDPTNDNIIDIDRKKKISKPKPKRKPVKKVVKKVVKKCKCK